MARGRKSETIKQLTHRDTNLLKQLGRTGISNVQQAKKYCNLNQDRIKKLEKSGYIKTSDHIVRGENIRIIQIDKLGKEYNRQEEGILMSCTAQTNHLEHDLKLTETYYSLDEEIQNTWRHEGLLVQDIYSNHPEMQGNLKQCVDATIVVNSEVIAIESVGGSYRGIDIEMKQDVAINLLGCSGMECV